MDTWRKIKSGFNALLEIVFLLTYIVTIALAILDIFGLLNIINNMQWTKILVMLFCTVGMVVLSDKRKVEVDIAPQINTILSNQNVFSEAEKEVDKTLHNLEQILDKEMDVTYFSDKTQFYLFLSGIVLKIPSGAKVDVTSFEKNYNVAYDTGEDVHIESFMKTWTELVKSGRIFVRQLVHVTSPQDYVELCNRVKTFKDNYNFTVSALVGLPIVPFLDYIILNQEYVVIGFSDDMSSPNNLSFGYAIKSKELALNFQNHFNIYWSGQFSTLIKDKDEIKEKNLKKIQEYIYDIEHNANLKKYNQLTLEIYHLNEHNNKIIPFMENLNRFYRNICYDILEEDVETKINECVKFVDDKIKNYVLYERNKASELISKMIFNSRKKIYAVSLDIDGNEFWVADEGEKVFRANIDAISKKAIYIERVFVCPEEKKAELKTTIDEQLKAGIKLYYTEYKQGIGGTFEDFLIIDDEALLILDKNAIRISINYKHINIYYDKFERIKKMGNKIK